MPKQEPIAELLSAIDALLESRLVGEENNKAWAMLARARRNVGEVKATSDQLLAVLEQQIASLFLPVINEHRLCELLGCSKTWLWDERKAGRWLNYETDARGRRLYTREQIIANLRGEKPKTSLKAA